ncbi:LTA synthase family protein [Clostridiaceae bacterium OttesenSCG-928-D20]|nr:LTA synthase family protein [Clostridiaceae bacterium OttesenSCG-928-D20]
MEKHMSTLQLTKKRSPLARLNGFYQSPLCDYLFFLSGPVLLYVLVELLNNNKPFGSFSTLQVVLNLFWYYIIFFISFLISRRIKSAAIISSSLIYAIGTINHYVFAFRGRTLFPGDLLSLKTAANVMGNYDYTPDKIQIYTFIALLLYILLIILRPKRERKKHSILFTGITLLLTGFFIITFFFTPFVSQVNLKPSLWSTRGNGLFLNFSLSLKYSSGDKPEGYSDGAAESLMSAYSSDSPAALSDNAPENVIVIMGESFADLKVYSDFPVTENPTPFYDSLDNADNCIKGFAYSSVFGGTTANSEYEFLTGNTMSFFPTSAVPYQLNVDKHSSSMVSQMKALGYRTLAMHPYLASGWNRVAVYESFGFEEVLFKNDFTNRAYMRNYITDQCNYENLVRKVEEKEKGEKLFLFNITMQNHSGYSVDYNGLPDTIRADGVLKDAYPKLDQFLSLMKQSDLALEWLLDYFSALDERTIILIFGDHQPQIETGFIEMMIGGDFESRHAESQQLRQMVPYILWANYDIEEAEGGDLSINYLSSLLFEKAELPMTAYQKFLSELSKKLPVINALGFKTDENEFYGEIGELPEDYKKLAEEYNFIQYNETHEGKSKNFPFFSLSQ